MLARRPIFQTMRVAPLVRPSGQPSLWQVIPPFEAPCEVGVDDHHRRPPGPCGQEPYATKRAVQ